MIHVTPEQLVLHFACHCVLYLLRLVGVTLHCGCYGLLAETNGALSKTGLHATKARLSRPPFTIIFLIISNVRVLYMMH
jgi:hypothetical protein